ncbi:MAG TPA: hypothetical protein VF185_01825 [Patescibacteria group bacterium]
MGKIIKQGLIIGVINLIVTFILSQGLSFLIPSLGSQYQSGLFRPWTDPLMMLFFLHPFIVGFVLAYFWNKLGSHIEGKKVSQKALNFAILYFLIATIPGMFVTYTSFNVSALMVGVWTVEGFIAAYIAGFILAKSK